MANRKLLLGVNLLSLLTGATLHEETGLDFSLLQYGVGPYIEGGLPYVQKLKNDGDLSYFGDIAIGGQIVNGIFDTGSFELVVMSTACHMCFLSGDVYDPNKSSTHVVDEGRLPNMHMYGSGLIVDKKAEDRVSIGDGRLQTDNFSFWEVYGHIMPIMIGAEFGAIVGMGRKGTVPAIVTNGTEVSLLEAVEPDVDRFSVCFGREPASPGWWTWGAEVPPAAKELHVIGEIHWGLNLTNVRLPAKAGGKTYAIGCEKGCGAVMDTGTSLIAAPREALKKLEHAISKLDPKCKNIDDMPDLLFELDGEEVSLPPTSYIGILDGLLNPTIEDLLYFKPGPHCQPLFIAMDEMTQYGPMWIVGMPFFREYHTTFESFRKESGIAKSKDTIFVAPASSDCKPMSTNLLTTSATTDRKVDRRVPLRIDAAKLKVPTWLTDTSKGKHAVLRI